MRAEDMIVAEGPLDGGPADALLRCIEQCYACAQACTACADACLTEPMVDRLRSCIRLNLDCADICAVAGSVATRRAGSDERSVLAVLEACATVCGLCGHECEQHAMEHDHCRICAETCRRCEQACREAIQSLRSLH